MVSQVVTYKRERESRGRSKSKSKSRAGQSGENAQLLKKTQKESYYEDGRSSKKKGPLAKLFKKKSKAKAPQVQEYIPPTPPATPESPLNVTVVTGAKKAEGPRSAFPINDALSTISELTYNGNTPNRKVDFDPGTKTTPPPVTPTAPSVTLSSASQNMSLSTRGGGESAAPPAQPTSTNFCGSASHADSVLARTINYFDGLCAPVSSRNSNGDIASETNATDLSTRFSDKSSARPIWGIIPSEDEDDDTFNTSAVDDSTYPSHDQSHSFTTPIQQQQQHKSAAQSGSKRRLSDGVDGSVSKAAAKQSVQDSVPTHENFEVILDRAITLPNTSPKNPTPANREVQGSAAVDRASATPSAVGSTAVADVTDPAAVSAPVPAPAKKRGWFSSRKSSTENKFQEEKKEDDDNGRRSSRPVSQVQSVRASADKAESRPEARPVSSVRTSNKVKKGKRSDGAGRDKKGNGSWRQSKDGSMQTMRILKEVDAPETIATDTNKEPKSSRRKSRTDKASATNTSATVAVSAVGDGTATAHASNPSKESSKTELADENGVQRAQSSQLALTSSPPAPDQKSRGRKTKDRSTTPGGKTKRNKSWGAFARIPFMSRKHSKDDAEVKYGKSTPVAKSQSKVPSKTPKPMWKAVNDPNTNRTYYYHRKTRETTWIKPQELIDFEASGMTKTSPSEAGSVRSGRSQEIGTAISKKSISRSTYTTPTKPAASDATTPTTTETPAAHVLDSSMESSILNMTASPERIALTSSISMEELSPIKVSTVHSKSAVSAVSTAEPAAVVTPTSSASPPQAQEKSDDMWEKKKEVMRLLHAIPESSREKAQTMMREHPGDVEHQLTFLRNLLESRPFDEPDMEAPMDEPRFTFNVSPPRQHSTISKRVITGFSRTSATTKSSVKTDKTEKIDNTGRSLANRFEPISEVNSPETTMGTDRRDTVAPLYGASKPVKSQDRVPSKVPVVHRKRELRVEDLSDSRLSAETYERNGRVIRGRQHGEEINNYDADSYFHSEADTYGDSVSALSENDQDFSGRKDTFENARRRALEDAIEREDWELAAALTEGMKAMETTGDYKKAHGAWKQSEIDKFIAQNNWDAVSTYIAKMRNRGPVGADYPAVQPQQQSQQQQSSLGVDRQQVRSALQYKEQTGEDGLLRRGDVIMSPSANTPPPAQVSKVVRAPSRTRDHAEQKPQQPPAQLEKRIGSRSQLQHREITSDSSWTSEDSYETFDSDFS